MHRQSLGSPATKLHLFSGAGVITDDITTTLTSEDNRSKEKSASCSTGDNELERKSLLVSSSTKFIHLIPLLTFLCFLILYLSSHDPSRKDLAQFSGVAAISSKKNVIDSFEIDDIVRGGFMEIEKNDVFSIRSMRNLKQQERRRFHRKFGQ